MWVLPVEWGGKSDVLVSSKVVNYETKIPKEAM